MNSNLAVKRARAQLGLSLIEILVGVAIGIVGVLAIFQTLLSGTGTC